MDAHDDLRRVTAKEEVAEWWRKVHAAFPKPGEKLVHAGYAGSKASITKEVCEIWTTSPENADSIRGIETNQTHFANYHCGIHGEPISNEPSWETRLSCGKVKHYIEKCGVIVLRAVLHSNLAEVAGYISGNARTAPDTNTPYVHVNHICVLPQHRNTGIGRMLWEAFLLYFENQEENSTREIQLEVYMKNEIARKWYQSLGFVDINFKDGCRTMKRFFEKDSVAISLKSSAVAKACQVLPQLLKQLGSELDILPWSSIVSKLEDQAQSLLQVPTSTSASSVSPVELGGLFTGSWQIRVNGNAKMWGRAFVGPLGVGFFDVKGSGGSAKHHESLTSSLQAIRIDGIGGPLGGAFSISNAVLAQSADDKLEWKWGRTGRSVWTRDTVAKSPLMSTVSMPGATVVGEFRRAVFLLRTCVAAARRQLWPIEKTLEEDVRTWLRTLLEPRIRLPQSKLQEIDTKLDRLERKYGGADCADSLKRKESENSECDSEIMMKTGIKKFRSIPTIPMKLGLATNEPLDV